MLSLTIKNNSSLIHENVIPLNDIPDLLPYRPCPAIIQRWLRIGINGVYLESFIIGKRRYTSKEAVFRFIERMNSEANQGTQNLKAKKEKFNLPPSGMDGKAAKK